MTMKEKIMDTFQSPLFSWIISCALWVIGIGFILTITFLGGEAVGYHKAGFSGKSGENYNRIFGGHTGPLMDNNLASPHGAFGTVVKIALPEVVISGSDGTEKTIVLTPASIIRRFRDDISSTTVAVGDTIIVIGNPDDQGRTVATLIRIVPAAPALPSSSSQPNQ